MAKEALINSTNVMKGEAHGTQQPRPINLIDEGVSTALRSNSLVQSITQRFPNKFVMPWHADKELFCSTPMSAVLLPQRGLSCP
jgi:hypothetical protein